MVNLLLASEIDDLIFAILFWPFSLLGPKTFKLFLSFQSFDYEKFILEMCYVH